MTAEEIEAARLAAEKATDKTNTKPEDYEALKKENERLRGTVQTFQKKVEEFDTFKKEIDRSKLSEADRVKAEIEEQRQARAASEAKAAALEAELKTQKLVNELVADHGLTNPEFGEVIVKKFDPEKESFNDFAKRVAADAKYAPVFGRAIGTTEKGPNQGQTRAPAPPGPSGGGSRAKTPSNDEQDEKDRAWAKSKYPGDEVRQKNLLAGLKAQRTRQ
jgi:hypothetical protein